MADLAPDMPVGSEPIWAQSAAEIAADWGVSVRRVRQLAEEGRLRRCGRARFDVAHGNLVQAGMTFLGQDKARSVNGDTLATVGWLRQFVLGKRVPVSAEDLAHWRGLCTRWGLSADDASALIARAAALCGDLCPQFETSAR